VVILLALPLHRFTYPHAIGCVKITNPKWEDNIKVGLKKQDGKEWTDSGQGQALGSCRHNETLSTIKIHRIS